MGKKNKLSYKAFWLLFFVVVLGAMLRFANISPYKFYPDSYQNLIVAKNIIDYGSVAGELGENGISYPPYFMWSRPVYPALIVFVNKFTDDLTLSSQLVAYLFGVLAIFGSYLLYQKIFTSSWAGLFGATLLAVSFNHTVWSGFIMSDTTGIFFLTLVFSFIFTVRRQKSQVADFKELITGLLFSVAFFSRYEYLVLLAPILYLLFNSRNYKTKIINFIVGFFTASSLIFALLFPVKDTLRLIFEQSPQLIYFTLLSFSFFAVAYFFKDKVGKIVTDKRVKKLSLILLVLTPIPLIINLFNINLFYLIGLGNFIKTDFLITSLALFGLSQMVVSKKYRVISIFVIITITLMEGVYFQINPLQQRYHSHLILILLIPAVYGLLRTKEFLKGNGQAKPIVVGVLVCITLYQTYLTFSGIKSWHGGDWFKKSYEEVSARILAEKLNGDEILVTALPEVYFYFSNQSTRSLSEVYPYLYVKDLPGDKEMIIINDIGLRQVFPEFSSRVQDKLKNYKTYEYKTGINFRYRSESWPEDYPVEIYKLKVEEYLKLEI